MHAVIAFDEALRERVTVNMARHEPRQHLLDGRNHAAVAIVVVDGDDGAAVLLCRRTPRLRGHSGQWALPGGRLDPGEDVIGAGLRELDEELGLRLDTDAVIGRLDDYPTRSGYVMSPVVLWAPSGSPLRPSPDEVTSVHEVGLGTLSGCEPRFVSIPESDRPVIQLPLVGTLIHAPTAAVLYQFRQVALLGRAGERVDHLEQPVFAWR